ncbi:MAG: DUF929 family protein [Nitrososphaerota archaeon]|nr:DUF929 family protein [Nitrososphaerota archaeon]
MPKCSKCGKKFDTLQALNDHFRKVHPSERFVAPKTSATRNLTIGLVVVLIVVGSLVGYLIYVQSTSGGTTTSTGPSILNQPISTSLYQNLSGVSFQTLSSIGVPASVTSPTPISGTPLNQTGKPEILYIGAEFCPYCAAERWSLVVALSKFGNFTGLEYMRSAPNDGNVTTLTFVNSTYVSPYVAFVSVENENVNHAPLQSVNAVEQQLWNQYNANSYPFVYMDGKYIVTSSQYSFSTLNNLNWTQIGSQLNDPNSNVAQAIDGAANTLISAICKIDNGQPASVCGQSFANVSFIPQHQVTTFENLILVSNQETAFVETTKLVGATKLF